MSRNAETQQGSRNDIAIGAALRDLREDRGLTARQLAAIADISTAMISRIENGQVSPSISTLDALSKALDVPLVTLFRETGSHHADFTHVKNGEGLRSARILGEHHHEFINLSFHTRRDLQFESRIINLVRQPAKPPTYVGHGVVFSMVKLYTATASEKSRWRPATA
jgi:transcriptional regulator with XRE-family HTH domain